MTKTRMRKVKAWAFLAYGNYFITTLEGETEIYTKKPKSRPNPFDYSLKPRLTWKPTEITIALPTKRITKKKV